MTFTRPSNYAHASVRFSQIHKIIEIRYYTGNPSQQPAILWQNLITNKTTEYSKR